MHAAECKGVSDGSLGADRYRRRCGFMDATTDANNSAESTPTTTCRERGISTTVGEKFEQLVDTVRMTLVRPDTQTSYGVLRFATEGRRKLGNDAAGAAHRQGAVLPDRVGHPAAIALHLATANMAFVVEACPDLEHRERRSQASDPCDRGVNSARECRWGRRMRQHLAADGTA